MLTTVRQIHVIMAVHVLMEMAGYCVPVPLASPDQFVKLTLTSAIRPRAAMVQRVKIKSMALNASVLQKDLDHVVKVGFVKTLLIYLRYDIFNTSNLDFGSFAKIVELHSDQC